MHHMYPTQKGDTLCPLGFHPQVRWPTRCKRCFRDYKEHGGNKGSLRDITSSTPSLSPWEVTSGRSSETGDGKRTWASATNLAKDDRKQGKSELPRPNWTSALDLTKIGQEEDENGTENFVARPRQAQKLQIKEVISNTNGASSDNDVEFIVQVKKSRTVGATKNAREEAEDAEAKKGGKTEKNEIERLKSQLNEMKARCERTEKEKSEILLRKLANVDSVTNKTEAGKLQKSIKELQSKYEALMEEKTGLAAKIKSMEKEYNSKFHKNEKEKSSEDLRSKLKAAEALCESLMDENEDMKKEIRDLEEEIYEMQDSFREEQVDEYTNVRKNLEQSNKNCRILSFKLRKIERKAEQLELEKTDLEKKYEEVKRIEDVLKKFGSNYKSKAQKKVTEYTPRVQLKKMIDDMEKEIGDMVGIFTNIVSGKDVNIEKIKTEENNEKYDQLLKEHELLKQKFDDVTGELTVEREKKKNQENKISDDKKHLDSQTMKKKLDEAVSLREEERKSWDVEKARLNDEKEKLKTKLLSLSAEKLKIYNEVVQLKKDLESANSSEKNNAKMESVVTDLKKELTAEKEKNKKLNDELSSRTARETEISQTLSTVEKSKCKLDEETKRLKQELEETKTSNTTKIKDLNLTISDLKKKEEKLKEQMEKDKQSSETEISTLKKKVATLEKAGTNTKKLNEMKQTYNERILSLESDLKRWKQEYDELYERYNELADLKSSLQTDKKNLDGQVADFKRDLSNALAELEELRNSLKEKETIWRAEKTRYEDRLRDAEKSSANKPVINELNDQINNLKKENSSLLERTEDLKRHNDDLENKLKDYEAVSKVQRNLSADSSALETEIRKLKNALMIAEQTKKTDIAECKLRYENRITVINEEIQSIQTLLHRYKRERETYKHMLEAAKQTIAELKTSRQRKQSNTSSGKSDEDDDSTATNIAMLETQISCMEDELSESKLEASRLKTELVSEKSAWHVKLSEMQSRINELEEERMLTSGRSKIPGLKVRMELAWQKEREDQQRLLQETATLARDLRQTLFEVERERDKERLENKRRHDQLKKVFDEEKEENKKKLIELQCDLLELRDAHAKLRTSNEKMRREKERHEKEREEMREVILSKRRTEQTEMRNIHILLQQVDDLMKLFPELNNKVGKDKPDGYTPTPPRRLKSKSRESSPMLDSREDLKSVPQSERAEKLGYTINKLMGVAKELKDSKKAFDDVSAKRLQKFGKRSTSVESEPGKGVPPTRVKPRLNRKSLSLEQTSGRSEEPQLWGTDSNVSSLQSLEGSEIDTRAFSLQRDSSVDSRLSGGSTKSEMLPREKKYNKSVIRKITSKLIKSNSVDDPNTSFDSIQTSGSELSLNEGHRLEKKNLKKKLTDMFKRGSRSNSLDRKSGHTDSRPSSRNSMASKI